MRRLLALQTAFCVLVCILYFGKSTAQNSLSLKLQTFTAHPFAETNASLHQNTLGKSGLFTLEPGLILSYESQFARTAWFDISASMAYDRFESPSGFVFVGARIQIFRNRRHRIHLGIGPALHYAGSRSEIEGYQNEEKYTQSDFLPNYKVSYISGFLEYNVIIDKQTAFSLSLVHSHPYSLGLAAGIRFRKIGNGKGCNCPGYK